MKTRNEFVLADNIPITTVGDLKKKFYEIVIWKQKELYNDFKRCKVSQEPQRLILNPPGFTGSQAVLASDVYIAIYYRGYYVRIEHGKSMFGPHKFELLYQVRKGCQVWLGIKTHKFLFPDEKKIKKLLRDTILAKDFYCSPETGAEIIELQTNSDINKVSLDI